MARSKINIPADKPWMLPPRELADVLALKALAAGKANEDQQRRAYEFILKDICGVQFLAYQPDSVRDTDFALGKQFVGHTIVKFVNLNPDVFKQETGNDNRSNSGRTALTRKPAAG